MIEMQLFYDPNLDNSVSQFSLGAEESGHIVKVLRKKAGDELQITNGKGYLFKVELLEANIEHCRVEVIATHKEHEKMHSLHLAVAPTKMNDRFEWFLEKVTEIGINEITPIICERSERKVIKRERMERVIQSAMKQSLRTFLPKLNEAVPYSDFVAREHKGLLFIAHCENEEKMDLKRCVAADHNVTILIGPEGDFAPSEIDEAYHSGFLPVSLGDARLRTETAAIVACTIVNLINSV